MNVLSKTADYTKALMAVVLLTLFQARPILAAEAWQAVFDPYRVQTLHLQMDTNDWDRVRWDQPSQSESWVPQVAEALLWADGDSPISSDRAAQRRIGHSSAGR